MPETYFIFICTLITQKAELLLLLLLLAIQYYIIKAQ